MTGLVIETDLTETDLTETDLTETDLNKRTLSADRLTKSFNSTQGGAVVVFPDI